MSEKLIALLERALEIAEAESRPEITDEALNDLTPAEYDRIFNWVMRRVSLHRRGMLGVPVGLKLTPYIDHGAWVNTADHIVFEFEPDEIDEGRADVAWATFSDAD